MQHMQRVQRLYMHACTPLTYHVIQTITSHTIRLYFAHNAMVNHAMLNIDAMGVVHPYHHT